MSEGEADDKRATGRARLIQTVQTPLGFFVLVVLVVEAVFGIIAGLSQGPERSYTVIGMFVLIFALVAIVAMLAVFRPESLAGTRPASADKPQSTTDTTATTSAPAINKRAPWATFYDSKPTIVVGRFVKEFEAFEQSGLFAFGDAMALAELQVMLAGSGLTDCSVSFADLVQGEALRSNLIVLGGSHPNTITREIVERVKPTLHFGSADNYQIAAQDSVTKKVYIPKRQTGGNRAATDYGIIIRCTNPFSTDRKAIIVAGSFGYGTWAGVRFLLSETLTKHRVVSRGKNFECLIEVDVLLDTPQDIRLLELRELAS
jgi:hypothetical protein